MSTGDPLGAAVTTNPPALSVSKHVFKPFIFPAHKASWDDKLHQLVRGHRSDRLCTDATAFRAGDETQERSSDAVVKCVLNLPFSPGEATKWGTSMTLGLFTTERG